MDRQSMKINVVLLLTFAVSVVLIGFFYSDETPPSLPPAMVTDSVNVSAIMDKPERVITTEAPYVTPEPTTMPATIPIPRFALTDAERDMMAKIIWIEARGEPFEGQQAVAEVIFNRVLAENFPDTVEDVIFQSSGDVLQFSSAPYIDSAKPEKMQYDAIDAALSGDSLLPEDVVYFSRSAENDRVWGTIGAHMFCYQYDWG